MSLATVLNYWNYAELEEDPGESSGKCGHSDQAVCSAGVRAPSVDPGGLARIRLSTVVRPQDGDRAHLGK